MVATAMAVIRLGRRLDFSQEVVGGISAAKWVSRPDSSWCFESFAVATEKLANNSMDTSPHGI
jgi:hypothetical protein